MRVGPEILDRYAVSRRQRILGQYRREVILLHRCRLRADAAEVPCVGLRYLARQVIRQRFQIAWRVRLVAAQDTPGTGDPAVQARVDVVGIVGLATGLVLVRQDRRAERELFRNASRLCVAPAGVLGLTEACSRLQPLQTVDADRVLLLVGAGLHLDVHAVALEGAHHWRERITAVQRTDVVDTRTEDTACAHAVGIRRRRQAVLVIQLGNLARTARRIGGHRKGEVALPVLGLATAVLVDKATAFVRTIVSVRVIDARRQRLVAIVDHVHARIVGADRLGARPWHYDIRHAVHKRSARTIIRELPDIGREFFESVRTHAICSRLRLLAKTGRDGLAERIRVRRQRALCRH